MPSLSLPTLLNLPRITLTSIVDILIVAFVIYQCMMLLRGRRAAPILAGIFILIFVYLVATWAHLELLRTILATAAPFTPVALIVMFQSELRRMLARLGRTQLFGSSGRLQRREMVQEIVLAVSEMAQQKVGALIVMERDIGLRTFIESGVSLHADISRDLLRAIFEPNAALHDGAVIIQRERIAAAACFLPLTMNPQLLGNLGTRHRAAIGITEEADCLSIIVSEETGNISVAAFGEIESNITPNRLEERIGQHGRHRDPKPHERDVYVSEAGTREAQTAAPGGRKQR